MSRDSVTDESNCKPEWTAALKFKKPILLLRLHGDADSPFRIASRQYIDFVADYNVGLAKLRKDLQWLHSPEGELQTLKYRLQDAVRDFNRAPDAERPRIQADIDLLRKQIGSTNIGNFNNGYLALAHLYAGNLPAARAAAETARQYDEPRNNHNVLALLGIIALRQNGLTAAQEAFTAAIAHADVMLERSAQNYDALDAKGIALCGLGLCRGGVIPPNFAPVAAPAQMGDMTSPLQDTVAAFRAARTINQDAGVVARVVRLLDALALAVPNGAEILAEARKMAGGE